MATSHHGEMILRALVGIDLVDLEAGKQALEGGTTILMTRLRIGIMRSQSDREKRKLKSLSASFLTIRTYDRACDNSMSALM